MGGKARRSATKAKVRAGSRSVSVASDGLMAFLYDADNQTAIRDAELELLEGWDGNARQSGVGRVRTKLVAYEMIGDGDIEFELIVGTPLSRAELGGGGWLPTQEAVLALPSGTLRVHSYGSLPMGEGRGRGGRISVRPGTYHLRLYRRDHAATGTDVVVLTRVTRAPSRSAVVLPAGRKAVAVGDTKPRKPTKSAPAGAPPSADEQRVFGPIRAGSERLRLGGSGDFILLFDGANGDVARAAWKKFDFGNVVGKVLAYQDWSSDDDRAIELVVGKPLGKGELAPCEWGKVERSVLSLPTGQLEIHAGSTVAKKRAGARLSVPAGDYRVAIHRKTWDDRGMHESRKAVARSLGRRWGKARVISIVVALSPLKKQPNKPPRAHIKADQFSFRRRWT
jgi:hypothetical protein